MAIYREIPSNIVEAVSLSFYTPDDVRKLSVKNITSPELLDAMGVQTPGGLYDPAMGPINEADSCKTCGQQLGHCPGHCGHIELVKPLFNPLMFRHLRRLLNITCLFCHYFRIEKKKLRDYVTELEHIVKGDIASAGRIGEPPLSEIFQVDIKEEDMKMKNDYKDTEEKSWTSLQHADYLAVLTELFKKGPQKCAQCGRAAPKIDSPTFGWLKKAVKSSDIRANFIRGCTSGLPSADEDRLEDAVSGDASGSGEMVTAPTTVSDQLRAPLEFVKRMHTSAGEEHLLPSEVELILKDLWRNETQLCMILCNIQQNSIAGSNKLHTMFILESLIVPPSKFRPPASGSRGDIEHSHNVLLHKVQEANCALREIIANDSDHPDTIKRWMNLQMSVNLLFNSNKGLTKSEKENNGYCQSLEKKKGVFRQNMMGKRANFTARTVVTPDPFLKVHEIGIPECFAIKLSYPERVTPRNVDGLRHAVANGADKYPGASHFVDKGISYKLNVTEDICKAISRKLSTSRVSTFLSGKSPEHEYEEKVVNRHLKDSDVVLANRQPTLHKPSMMAFEVRILKEVKTMRMHYANCRSFNLDFDGDEINIHLPQDEIARAEAINVVNANKQYISQTNGEPIRGLIQDHIISAFLLSKKDMFLTREEYHQLLYASCATLKRSTQPGKFGEKACTLISENEIEPLHPAIWKPKPLWTGKQVFTAILCHVTRGYSPFSIEKDGKIGKEYIAEKCEERKLYIYNNELIHGVIDKAQFEKYGLVHTVHKLYGANISGNLLSIFSRLFTTFLHMHAFTCGVEDILLLKKSYMQREQLLNKCEELSEKAHLCFISQRDNIERELTLNESEELSEKGHLHDMEREQTPNESEELSEKAHLRDIGPLQLHREIEKILRCRGESAITSLDRRMFDAFSTLTSDVNDKVIPKGLQKPFPKNCISLMTTTGAKGGKVNFTNITSLLGQVSLEGKRVPRIISGKTLPCFPPWDISCRAGGYISDCFLTGLRPQEYYFYCMAGRDGLVDTAIKTASIGYLQRRLIKNLESLKVCYDYTVRDADGSIVQFTYGEDGVDVSKTSYITDGADVKKEKYIPELEVLANNQQVVLESLGQSGNGDLSSLNGFIEELPESLRVKASHFARHILENGKGHHIEEKDLMKLVNLTYLSRLANPGEAVGVIAGQSVGEPSTQMTLNTFHLAGQGEANVTLGIPRLQEILMNAKENVKTSIMTCPLPKWSTKGDAKCLAVNLRRICVADIIQSIDVSVRANYIHNGRASTLYKLEMKLYRMDRYPHAKGTLRTTFVNAVEVAIRKHLALTSRINNVNVVIDKEEAEEVTEEDIDGGSGDNRAGGSGDNRAGDNDDDQDDDNDQNEDADSERRKKQSSDEVEYEDNDLDSDPESGTENGVDRTEAEDGDNEVGRDDESDILPDKKMPDSPSRIIAQNSEKRPKAKMDGPKGKADSVLVSVRVKGSKFKAYFALTDEPYILLAQIAGDTAKSVFIKESKNIEKCSVVEPKQGRGGNRFELQTVGVNFPVFWDLQDQLDINKLYVTDVHAMLKTYGVEAARATIIKEVKAVFGLYGIEVNIRHLSLIADYMTSHGTLRPMNRFGIAYSTSTFSKMTMETAAKFITDAAFHAERDTLQSPSASISLGQPVKLGTGIFDLLHNY